MTPDKEVPGSIPAVAARSLLVGNLDPPTSLPSAARVGDSVAVDLSIMWPAETEVMSPKLDPSNSSLSYVWQHVKLSDALSIGACLRYNLY